MIKTTKLIIATMLMTLSAPALAKVTTGSVATDIQVLDSNNNLRTLSEFKGKKVVLEWTNHRCPYVKKHYGSGNMQSLQKQAAADGVVWLSVISSAPGKQGHVSAERANELTTSRGASPTAVLLDNAGTAGRAYEAKTTPHMYVIDEQQILVYQGAIDSNRSARQSTIEGATNYVTAALASLKAGTPVEVSQSQPYGCTVKY